MKDEKILDAPMTLTSGPVKVTGKVTGAGKAGYVVNHNAESALAQLRFRLKDVKIAAAEEGFKVGERSFNAGSFIIKSEGNPTDLDTRLKKEAADLGFTAIAVDELPKVAQHPLAVPRIALVHTWVNTQDEGWYRIEFDRLGIPYDYISDHITRDTANLREKWDVIVWGPARGSAQAIVRGVPKRSDSEAPIPWQKSDLTPNMGQSPDTTADLRGGMGVIGVANLQRFIESGGLFITVGSNAAIPIDFGITEGVSIQEALKNRLADRSLTPHSPTARVRSLMVMTRISRFISARLRCFKPAVWVASAVGGGGGGAFGQQQQGRPSGRGGVNDPDVIQGRRPLPPQPPRLRAKTESRRNSARKPPGNCPLQRCARESFCASPR